MHSLAGLNSSLESRRAGKSARNINPPAESNTVQVGRESTQLEGVCVCFIHQKKNEQNIEIIQGELQLQLEFLEQTPPVERWTFTPGGHPQTAGDRRNVDEETRLPGEEDRAGDYDSQEAWHEE